MEKQITGFVDENRNQLANLLRSTLAGLVLISSLQYRSQRLARTKSSFTVGSIIPMSTYMVDAELYSMRINSFKSVRRSLLQNEHLIFG